MSTAQIPVGYGNLRSDLSTLQDLYPVIQHPEDSEFFSSVIGALLSESDESTW